jgi:hypothetical protein
VLTVLISDFATLLINYVQNEYGRCILSYAARTLEVKMNLGLPFMAASSVKDSSSSKHSGAMGMAGK